MTPEASSFAFLLGLARSLLEQVQASDGLADGAPQTRPSALRRLAGGVRLLASFVRRLLVLMALRFEHGLVDRVARPLVRPHGRKPVSAVRFKVLEAQTVFANSETVVDDSFNWTGRGTQRRQAPEPPSSQRLNRLLDLLAAIVADPEPRARRLAFHLARRRHGPILPPPGPARIAGRWGTVLRTSHDAMAAAIVTASRARPPPLPPPRRAGPVVTCF